MPVAMQEGFIHVAVRRRLKALHWRLIAGQYPGGSDDELPPLNVVDPAVARDESPDPRRHSNDKLVPDLVALRDKWLLVTEMKPRYSKRDRDKLITLLAERRQDLLVALRKLAAERNCPAVSHPERLTIVPCLGFAASSRFVREPGFCYLLVHSLDDVVLMPPDASGFATE